jgi:hypothetical protein
VSGPFSDDLVSDDLSDCRTDDRILADNWLILLASAGRRAASKTNKSNTMARRVSIMGAHFGVELSQIETMLGLKVDP